MAKRLIDTLVQTKGWSAVQRFPYELKDANGTIIATVWLKPLTLAEGNDLKGGDKDELALRYICKSVFTQESEGERAFDVAEIAKMKRELSSLMINDLATAVLSAGKPPDNFIEEEKKD